MQANEDFLSWDNTFQNTSPLNADLLSSQQDQERDFNPCLRNVKLFGCSYFMHLLKQDRWLTFWPNFFEVLSLMNLSNVNTPLKNLWNAENQTQGSWVSESKSKPLTFMIRGLFSSVTAHHLSCLTDKCIWIRTRELKFFCSTLLSPAPVTFRMWLSRKSSSSTMSKTIWLHQISNFSTSWF